MAKPITWLTWPVEHAFHILNAKMKAEVQINNSYTQLQQRPAKHDKDRIWGPQTPDIVQRILNKILNWVFLHYSVGGGSACKNSCKCNIFVYHVNTLRVNKFCTWNRNLCPKIWSDCEYRTRTTVLFLKLHWAIFWTFGDLLLWCYILASGHFQIWSV